MKKALLAVLMAGLASASMAGNENHGVRCVSTAGDISHCVRVDSTGEPIRSDAEIRDQKLRERFSAVSPAKRVMQKQQRTQATVQAASVETETSAQPGQAKVSKYDPAAALKRENELANQRATKAAARQTEVKNPVEMMKTAQQGLIGIDPQQKITGQN